MNQTDTNISDRGRPNSVERKWSTAKENAAPAARASWVRDNLGIQLTQQSGRYEDETPIDELVSIALRRNPARAQLLVSRVIGRHVPLPPNLIETAAARLATSIETACPELGQDPLVIGFADAAVNLGHLVAKNLPGASYIHSTHAPGGAGEESLHFDEAHSHARAHRLSLVHRGLYERADTFVLVEDEVSTGQTLLNTIQVLDWAFPQKSYVIATLVDMRSDEARELTEQSLAETGLNVTWTSLSHGELTIPTQATACVNYVLGAAPRVPMPEYRPRQIPVHGVNVPNGAASATRGGVGSDELVALDEVARSISASVAGSITPAHGRPVLVLGVDELQYLPHAVARRLSDYLLTDVLVGSATRSPVLAVDEPGYPVRTAHTFMVNEEEPGERFRHLYNLPTQSQVSGVVLICDASWSVEAIQHRLGVARLLGALYDNPIIIRLT